MARGIALTLMACLLASAATGVVLFETTGGLAHWTFEDRRRALAREGQLSAPLLADASAPVHEIRIVDFIYTRCPTVCRVLGTEFQRLQQLIIATPQSPVRLLSVSIDPEHDGPVELRGYARTYGAQPPIWQVVASASLDENQRLRRSLGVVVIPDGMGGLSHNSALHLVDRDGRLLAIFDHADWRKALSHAEQLSKELAP